MNQQFYVAVNGEKTGPFSLDQLKSQNIKQDTLVWTEGMLNWMQAEHVALLKGIFNITPPPLPGSETKNTPQQIPPTPVISSQKTGKYFGYELARRRDRFLATLIESIILVIPFMLLFGDSYESDQGYSFESIAGSTLFSAILGAIFYSKWSGNLGHKILGLKVISSVDGSDQNKLKVGALREGLKNIFCLVLIPVIWLLWDENRQNLYDKVLNTYVVKKKLV